MMDIVYIKDLCVDTVIGIFEWERERKQTVCINIEIGCDIKKAAQSDSIEHAMDYKAISKRIIHFVETHHYQLIERLAEEIAHIILSEFKTPWVKVSLGKPGAIRGAKDVGVIIERGKK
jgi:dihydroneopterin aldolase